MSNAFKFADPVDKGYEFGDTIDSKEHSAALNSWSTVSYRYIDLDKTDYNFMQSCFDNDDARSYFEFMSMLTNEPFNVLYDEREVEWHLNPNNYETDRHFQTLVNKALELDEKLKVECQPSFFHFALYTNQNANRKTGVKSPRIYFFIGANAVIYPLFFDPYHEINPMPSPQSNPKQ